MLGIVSVGIFSAAPDINSHIMDIRLQSIYHFFQILLELITKFPGLIHLSAVDIGLVLHQRIITIGAVKEDLHTVPALFAECGQAVKDKKAGRMGVYGFMECEISQHNML